MSSASAVANSGRGSLIHKLLSRSIAMMSACLVIAQNGRYGGWSTHGTGLFARRCVSAACSRVSSAYAVGSASTFAASSIVGVLIVAPHSGLQPNLTGVKFEVYVTAATRGK